jgi:hypothetical protein
MLEWRKEPTPNNTKKRFPVNIAKSLFLHNFVPIMMVLLFINA